VSTPYSGGTPGAPPYGEPGYTQGGASSYVPPAPDYSDAAGPMTDDGHPDVEGTSVGALIGEVTRDLSTLMRQELELAKAEIRQEATKAGKATGMLAAAGFAGYMTAVLLSLALVFGLANLIGLGWSALLVAVLWAIAGAVLFSNGRKKLRTVSKPERTVESLKEDVEWAQHPTK